jgi:hypothetical protein
MLTVNNQRENTSCSSPALSAGSAASSTPFAGASSVQDNIVTSETPVSVSAQNDTVRPHEVVKVAEDEPNDLLRERRALRNALKRKQKAERPKAPHKPKQDGEAAPLRAARGEQRVVVDLNVHIIQPLPQAQPPLEVNDQAIAPAVQGRGPPPIDNQQVPPVGAPPAPLQAAALQPLVVGVPDAAPVREAPRPAPSSDVYIMREAVEGRADPDVDRPNNVVDKVDVHFVMRGRPVELERVDHFGEDWEEDVSFVPIERFADVSTPNIPPADEGFVDHCKELLLTYAMAWRDYAKQKGVYMIQLLCCFLLLVLLNVNVLPNDICLKISFFAYPAVVLIVGTRLIYIQMDRREFDTLLEKKLKLLSKNHRADYAVSFYHEPVRVNVDDLSYDRREIACRHAKLMRPAYLVEGRIIESCRRSAITQPLIEKMAEIYGKEMLKGMMFSFFELTERWRELYDVLTYDVQVLSDERLFYSHSLLEETLAPSKMRPSLDLQMFLARMAEVSTFVASINLDVSEYTDVATNTYSVAQKIGKYRKLTGAVRTRHVMRDF